MEDQSYRFSIGVVKNCRAIVGVLFLTAVAADAADSSLVARWDFDGKDSIDLVPHGGVKSGEAGPAAPEFPDLPKGNQSIRLEGNGARLMLADTGKDSRFKFRKGDPITLEAWVKLDGGKPSSPMYIIGKGRTGDPDFDKDNQNWSLRVVSAGNAVRLSFLFAAEPGSGTSAWHRWTSNAGFAENDGWHHVAVAYRFGESKSIRGWIDGKPSEGSWDLGGEAGVKPMVDDDAVWIGSALGGNGGNSFRGWLDAVAVHRAVLDDKTMAARFKRVGGPRVVTPIPQPKLAPEVMPQVDDVPADRVLLTMEEGFPSETRWMNEGEAVDGEFMRWVGDEFILPRIPLRHDDWGIRQGWKVPMLVRMVADVQLPPGKQRILLRARALGRLWIDGQLLARTKAVTVQPPNGEEPVTPVREPPLPGVRIAGYHQQEVFGEVTIEAGKTSRVVLELVVGGKNLRPETGEFCVAIETADGESFSVLRAGARDRLPLTDEAVEPVLAGIEESLSEFDDLNRRRAAASRNDFWEQRHAVAKEWVRANSAPTVPEIDGINHPIDAFVRAKIDRAVAASAGANRKQAEEFHGKILPLLRENCFRCHGEKEKGGLKLDSRERLLEAVMPGDPAKSELICRLRSHDEDERMPPTGDPLTGDQIELLEDWIEQGAEWPSPPVDAAEIAERPLVNDAAFLRRVYLDTLGVPPTFAEADAFLADQSPDRRERLIKRLLSDERGADNWVGYWQDMLAENPALLNQSQGSTGPFRWFIHDSLWDNKPLDRMVTELILLRGGKYEGGSAGFGMAAENDAPFAAKGHIVASAFLGIELQCARCHDSPYHSSTQRDLFSLAAMFERKPVGAPETSQVPADFFHNRERKALIQVTLKPGEQVPPEWRFAKMTGMTDGDAVDQLMQDPKDSRERLATLITAPGNRRFAQVVVNRIWKRLMGAGLVEPIHDWEGRNSSHPELLDWLAHQFVDSGFNANAIIGLILTSDAYQRQAIEGNLAASTELRFFSGPERRRLSAEQVVDSLFAATGNQLDIGELTFVHDGKRPLSNRQTLGFPRRAWMLADLNNERDRPSLSLPEARTITDVLEAFGWKGARQQPIMNRSLDPNVLQPGILANGTLVTTLSRAANRSDLAELAVSASSPEKLVETMFLRVLTRRPTAEEQKQFSAALEKGFAERVIPAAQVRPLEEPEPLPLITWFNHQRHEATKVQNAVERRIRKGPPADPRLRPEWREKFEDIVWSLINHREFVWIP
ncbi:MAG: mono/diheme cytochrome c family protein [Verrucomicrobiales bacterium]